MPDGVFEVFNNIYSTGFWGRDGNQVGYSGPGSTVEATLQYRLMLSKFIELLGIQTVVDAGCGDWTFSRNIDWGRVMTTGWYIGYDASEIAIEKAKRYEWQSRHFEVRDITEPLPQADLLLCKDVLQHLPNAMVIDFIRNNLVRGKYKWAIITNDKGSENRDIVVGDHRPLDLSLPPFNVRGLADLNIAFGVPGGKVTELLFLG